MFGTTLRTDRQTYSRNQPMQLCYTVPGQGLVVIRDNNGQTIYSQKCAACHGQNAEGGVGPKLAGLRISLERAQAQIEAGGSAMPGGLVKGQADRDVLAYLATILATP